MAIDFYAVLGVPPQADAAQIKAAFRQLARALHPDSATVPAAPDRWARVLAAWEVLHDPVKRAAYDRTRRQTAATTAPDRAERPGAGPERGDTFLVAGPTIVHTRTAPPPGPHLRVGPPRRLRD